ncbi:Bifunctional 3-dehydroquinate dehydratase/shikimate dehydrogenase protein [Thalictrum thalictroides]|uniref:Bifunctional 3-dehydroquinate dehydratase/shikimate dehydrogenase protein n=1 Tax=Thalictrum thalictroides TaxID=46969 RepID=A0A7J6W4B1_THATH|nr:Bifunctional 3-dehydroquinate dehydratase/shikimate dehydrogenase protein [Thalictrum thalictroides]
MKSNSTLICAPLLGDSVSQMLIDMEKAKAIEADVVEIRLDYIKDFNPQQDLETLIKQCPLPTLVTYRCGEFIENVVKVKEEEIPIQENISLVDGQDTIDSISKDDIRDEVLSVDSMSVDWGSNCDLYAGKWVPCHP